MIENSLPHVTLEHALNEVFFSLHYNSCLLTIGMNTVAIMMPFPGVFEVFDSHSRDVFGRPSALGYCVLISVEGVENLGDYFRLTSRPNAVISFELKGVRCIDNNMQAELSARVITNSKRIRRQNESTEQGITIDQNWLRSLPVSTDETCDSIETQNDADDETTSNIPDDQWSEDEAEIPAGTMDSMLTTSDFVSDNEKQEIYNFAPGEGNKPLSVFRDQFSEEMAYPGIFLGQKRPDDKERLRNVHYSEICKSELRRSDRRAAMCVENIFFKAKKLQMKFLIGQSQIALRKKQNEK